MPVSGNEEPVIIARESSSSSAGIPIKKRKFTLIQSPSPPPQEPSSPSVENHIMQNKHSTTSPEPSLSNNSDLKNSPTKSDVSKNSISEVKKEIISIGRVGEIKNILSELKKESPADTNINLVQNNANVCGAKVQEPSSTTDSGFIDNVERKEKLMQGGKSLCPKTPGDTELHFAPNEASALNIRRESLSKLLVERDCKLELSTVPGNAVLPLLLKEPIVLVLTGQNSEVTHRMHEKLDPSLSCLHVMKEKSITEFMSSDSNSNNHGRQVPATASRSNWDLNTTMDAWEGSLGDAPVKDTIGYDGLNRVIHELKPFVNSTGMAGVGPDTGKQRLEAGENRSNSPSLSLPLSQQFESDDSLHLSLSMSSCRSNFSEGHSGASAKVDSGKIFPNSSFSEGHSGSAAKIDATHIFPNSSFCGGHDSTGNMNSVGHKTVKPVPLDETAKNDCVGVRDSTPMSLDFRTVKGEMVDGYRNEAVKLQTISSEKLVHKSRQPKPVQVVNQEIHSTIEITSGQPVGKVVQSQDDRYSTVTVLLSSLPTRSGLCTNGDVSNQSGHSTCTKEVCNKCAPQGSRGSLDNAASEMISISVGTEQKASKISDGIIGCFRTEDLKVDVPETSRVKLMGDLSLGSRGNSDGSAVSDEGKINISAHMLEEDSYGSDYESDGNHAFDDIIGTHDRQCDKEESEYEDGEDRETLVNSTSQGLGSEVTEVENIIVGDYDTKNVDSLDFPGDGRTLHSQLDEEDNKIDDHHKKSEYHIQECVNSVFSENANKDMDKDGGLHEQSCLGVEMMAAGADEKRPIEDRGRKHIDYSETKETQQGNEKELSSDGFTDGSKGIVSTFGKDERVKEAESVEKTVSTLPKEEASLNYSDAFKDANSGGNRNRIIILPRGSNLTSPCKTRTIPDTLSSRTGRERYSDFEGEKWHPRGNRDKYYPDSPHKFVRNRYQDQPFRNSRLNFVRGRGRGSSRLNSQRSERVSDRDLAPEIFNGTANYRFLGHKQASAVTDAELECNDYVTAPDGAVVGAGRGGRKPLNDELPSFHFSSSRRISPGGRDGPPARRSIHMVHRIPRNICPSRCTDEDGSDVVALGHSEMFTRGLADDIMEPLFSRPQHPYEGLKSQFDRGNMNSSVQRSGVRQIRSKSPIRSRKRSPGPWSSSRRRSPDGCTLLPELTQRRSPAIYRIERMRSPDRPCFHVERVASRMRGSPPYMTRSSDDLRDVSSGRDHGQLRSVIPNRRSPSKRVLPRGTRRFDNLNPRERAEGDDYFGGPICSGRFPEFDGDGSADERRGLVRSFRPPYNGAEGERFRFQLEDCPRPSRFCPEAGPDFVERGTSREREFDRRFKNHPGITPRRMRSFEDQEGNYRHSGQAWQGDGFDDNSRVKRRRF